MDNVTQHYLGYVIELEAFSMLFRPREADTEFIQFQRSDYTPENAAQIHKAISQCAPNNDPSWGYAASLVFVYLLRTDQLLVMQGTAANGASHWFVQDRIASEVFEFDHRYGEKLNNTVHADAKPVRADGMTSMPSEACFDLLERLQPSARRYPVDERITVDNYLSSDFITKKRGMDYLYQNGVFGKFRK